MSIDRIKLSDFSTVTNLVIGEGVGVNCSAIDILNGFLYSANHYENPAIIRKISLDTFTLTSSLTLRVGEANVAAMLIDAENGFLYVGLNTDPATVVKIELDTFTEVSTVTHNDLTYVCIENHLSTADTEPGVGDFWGNVWALGESGGTEWVLDTDYFSSLVLNPGENELNCGVIDVDNDAAYFGCASTPQIVKITLSGGMTRVGVLAITGTVRSCAIDAAAGYAYWCLSPGATSVNILKMQLSDFSVDSYLAMPTVVTNEGSTYTCQIGHKSATENEPGVGVDWTTYWSLSGSGGSDWALDTFYLPVQDPLSCAIDILNSFLYFVLAFAGVIKVDLSDFSMDSLLPLSEISEAYAMVLGEVEGNLYVVQLLSGPSVSVTKVDLATFTEVASVGLTEDGEVGYTAHLD
jgi:hypothetical protein